MYRFVQRFLNAHLFGLQWQPFLAGERNSSELFEFMSWLTLAPFAASTALSGSRLTSKAATENYPTCGSNGRKAAQAPERARPPFSQILLRPGYAVEGIPRTEKTARRGHRVAQQ